MCEVATIYTFKLMDITMVTGDAISWLLLAMIEALLI